MAMAGIEPRRKMDGIDFWPAVKDKNLSTRDYVTVAWGPLVTVISEQWWYNASIWGKGQILNDVRSDENLENNLAADNPDIARQMLDLAVQDAGGSIPDAFKAYASKSGCTPYKASSRSAIMKMV